MTSIGGEDKNPYKTLIKQIDKYLESNKITIARLLTTLEPFKWETEGVSIDKFAKFLKEKVDKTKDIQNLVSYVRMMDIDNDGKID